MDDELLNRLVYVVIKVLSRKNSLFIYKHDFINIIFLALKYFGYL